MTQDENHTYNKTITKLQNGLRSVIHGRNETINLIIACLIADGHVLLEDYPGSGKTTLAKTLGGLIESDVTESDSHILPFRRVQFTPDMLPGDVLGVNIFEPKTGSFKFLHGPVFAHIVLADELNRTGPKVQSAFLECMAEKQVTVDNVTHKLDELFFVIGTQNPLDIAGTYPLPIVQLDRFMCRIPMSYVDKQNEINILNNTDKITQLSTNVTPVVTRSDILSTRETVKAIHVNDMLRESIIDIIQATRNNSLLQFGASTRAGIMLQSLMRAWAIVQGRDFTTEDDLVYLAPYVLLHRLKFHPGAGEPRAALRKIMKDAVERLVVG